LIGSLIQPDRVYPYLAYPVSLNQLLLPEVEMNSHVTIALILTRPGPLQHSLKTLLATLPEIEIVAEARELSTLRRLGRELQPDLILLEAGLPGDELHETIQQIRREWKHTRSIVLVETAKQEATAVAAGANVVLFTGHRATKLVRLINGLLADRENQSTTSISST
jgi:DNA-binding NarL/FixJ family response regulator